MLEDSLACKICRDRGMRAPRGTIERLMKGKTFGNDEGIGMKNAGALEQTSR